METAILSFKCDLKIVRISLLKSIVSGVDLISRMDQIIDIILIIDKITDRVICNVLIVRFIININLINICIINGIHKVFMDYLSFNSSSLLTLPLLRLKCDVLFLM